MNVGQSQIGALAPKKKPIRLCSHKGVSWRKFGKENLLLQIPLKGELVVAESLDQSQLELEV
jgi:hypothetical protein